MPQSAKIRRREDPETRRAQILEEAIGLIGERGFYGFAVHDLAQRCGITKGTLLYYFQSKEGLLIAVLEERDRRVAAMMPVDSAPSATLSGANGLPLDLVIQALRIGLARGASQPELQRLYVILQAEAMDAAHPAYAYIRKHQARSLDGLARMVSGHVADPRRTARQLLALMEGLIQQWLRSDYAFDLLADWDAAIALALPAPSTVKPVSG